MFRADRVSRLKQAGKRFCRHVGLFLFKERCHCLNHGQVRVRVLVFKLSLGRPFQVLLKI